MNGIVVKIGGSLLYDDDLNFNVPFLEEIVDWYNRQTQYDFVVFVVGGGKISRFVLNQVRDKINLEGPKHLVGMNMTQVNASIVFGMLNDTQASYFDSLEELYKAFEEPEIKGAVIGGVVEGWSTDMDAAAIANELGIDIVYKLTNIDYIYSADPSKDEYAKPYESMTWDEYIQLFKEQIGQKHEPGMNAPIDIQCATFCMENDIDFKISGGHLLTQGKKFEEILQSGTLVS
jgi:uridylate kinase